MHWSEEWLLCSVIAQCISSSGIVASTGAEAGTGLGGAFVEIDMYQKGESVGGSLANVHNNSFEDWGESGMAAPDNSHQTDTSTDVEADDRNHVNTFNVLLFKISFPLIFIITSTG